MKMQAEQEPDLPAVQKRVELRPYNTMRVSSTACRMVTITHRYQLTGLFREGVLSGPVLVLVGGSNILFRCSTERLVVKNEIRLIRPGAEADRHKLLKVGAGVAWHEPVRPTGDEGLGGLD